MINKNCIEHFITFSVCMLFCSYPLLGVNKPIEILNLEISFEKDSVSDYEFFNCSEGEKLTIDASQSFDPDGDDIFFTWHYDVELSTYNQSVQLQHENDSVISFNVPNDLHDDSIVIFLELKDNGIPAVSSYKGIVIKNKDENAIIDTKPSDTITNQTSIAGIDSVILDSLRKADCLLIECAAGEDVILDASESYDPDGDSLLFYWRYDKELSTYTGDISISNHRSTSISFQVPTNLDKDTLNIFLQLKDDGVPVMINYRRIAIINKDAPEDLSNADSSDIHNDYDNIDTSLTDGNDWETTENEDGIKTSIDKPDTADKELKVYPNPAKDRLFIRFLETKQPKRLHIVDLHGRIMRIVDSPNSITYLNIIDIPSASYFIVVEYEDGTINKALFVKQ